MAAYATLAHSEKPAAEWLFLTTASPEKLRPILDAYGQAVDRKRNPGDPTGPLNHTLRVFLIDREGTVIWSLVKVDDSRREEIVSAPLETLPTA